MRLAFEKAGGRCVFTSEWDAYAKKTYVARFGDHALFGDITKIEMNDIPKHDILVAGFPCQPFSIAGVSKKNALGREHGFRDPTQGTLFFNVKEIIRERRPRAFLLENVKHLLRHDRGQTFEVIRRTLEDELHYNIDWDVLDARCFVPQHRERIFIVGFRDKVDFQWPKLPRKTLRLESILSEEPVPAKYTLSNHLWKYLRDYAAKHRARGNGFGYGLFGPRDIARTLSARYYKDGSEILIDQGSGNPRRLTPRECASLMGYPRNFPIPVSDTRAYKQFGNSVVVPLVTVVARSIVRALNRPADQWVPKRGGSKAQLRMELTPVG